MNPHFELVQVGKPSLSQKQAQALIMSAKMQQGIYFLQLPIQELESAIEEEIDKNPLLEILETEEEEDLEQNNEKPVKELSFDEKNFELLMRLDNDFKDNLYQENFSAKQDNDDDQLHTFLTSLIQKRETLFDTLMTQSLECFSEKNELSIAECLIGSLDERGFMTSDIEEIAFLAKADAEAVKKVLKKIQEFDPPGIAAINLKESLLIQLKRKGLYKTLPYLIVEDHFDDLIQNRMNVIKAKLKVSVESIKEAVKEFISTLDLKPGFLYNDASLQQVIPDISIIQEDDNLIVKVNSERLPELTINRSYMKLFHDKTLGKDEQEFLKNKIESAKWLIKNIFQRQSTLERIGHWLLEKQRSFFSDANGQLKAACMRELADDLQLHESPIARAIGDKYLYCDRGMLPMRKFFTASYTSLSGETLSAKTVKDILKEIIGAENKKKPLSDQLLENELKKKGIPCKRRTIAKYRLELNIGNVRERREF